MDADQPDLPDAASDARSGRRSLVHVHDGPNLASPGTRRTLTIIVAILALATLVAMVALRPTGDDLVNPEALGFSDVVDATVTDARLEPCSFDPATRCDVVDLAITNGPTAGDTTSLETSLDAGAVTLDQGDGVVLNFVEDLPPGAPESVRYSFADYQRTTPLIVLAVLFAVAVVLLGRLQGVRALLGLALSLAVLLGFILPALVQGRSPLAVALAGSAAIAFVALYLAHGVNERTTVALLGTFASLALTGALGVAFLAATRVTGLADEQAVTLLAFAPSLDFQGLLLAGVIIGSLGVLDDVTVTQVSATWELHLADPTRPVRDLYRSAVRIGRDHIASTVNTLVLAYAAAALPLLLILSQSGRSLGSVLTSETVAVELVRTLVGSIGLVASVPITTALAAVVVTGTRMRRTPAPAATAVEQPA